MKVAERQFELAYRRSTFSVAGLFFDKNTCITVYKTIAYTYLYIQDLYQYTLNTGTASPPNGRRC